FLCRQTDLVIAAAKSGKTVHIKKGQFVSPWDMKSIVAKIAPSITEKVLLTERGASFGYNNLVVHLRSPPSMRELGYPAVSDATRGSNSGRGRYHPRRPHRAGADRGRRPPAREARAAERQ